MNYEEEYYYNIEEIQEEINNENINFKFLLLVSILPLFISCLTNLFLYFRAGGGLFLTKSFITFFIASSNKSLFS